MKKLHIDIETYSTNDIKRGVYKYTEAVELLLFAYAWDEAPVEVIDCMQDREAFDKIRGVLFEASFHNAEVYAHNAQFERVVLSKFFEEANKINWLCTKIRAYAHSLVGSLAELSEIFRLPIDKAKDKEGHKLIQVFCKPQKNEKRIFPKDEPVLWKKFIEYCRLDVEAERELDRLVPKWNDSKGERELWFLDQRINDRGFAVDIELAEAAIEAVKIDKDEKDKRTQELTDGAVGAATQRDALLKHLLEIHGVDLPDMTISTLNRRLEDPDLPEPVKELIALRLQSSGTSTKKYQTLLNSVSVDGRLKGSLQFCGAQRTGRWSGRIFQPQNLPRPKYKNHIIDMGIEALKLRCADILFDDVKDIAASAIRGSIVAPSGKKLVVADLSSIEGRGLAWLAGEQWKLNAYEAYDQGQGFDMYILTYARSFNVKPERVTKSQRQLGKVLELALGYGGGVGAFVTFAKSFGIDLDQLAEDVWPVLPGLIINEAENFWYYASKEKKHHGLSERTFVACDSLKRLWREANPHIADFWASLEDKVRYTVATGEPLYCNQLYIEKRGNWLTIRLPSGRCLSYPGIRLEEGKIKYLGVNQYSRKWGYLYTYGGKLAENATQAFCRDILAHGMLKAENAGYQVVLSVHDENITETPDKPEFNHKHLSQIMSITPEWATGLPLAAAGFEAYRYRKD